MLKNRIEYDSSLYLSLFATNKLHLSTYPRTPSGNPRQAVVQFVRSEHFPYSLKTFSPMFQEQELR